MVILPYSQIFFRTHPWLYKNADVMIFAVVVATLLTLYRNNLSALGFSTGHLKQHLVLGAFAGGTIILCLPLLDVGLSVTGMAEHELFTGRLDDQSLFHTASLPEKSAKVILIPLIEQIFFTGFILQTLLKKHNPILTIYVGGLIYTLAGFKLSLGSFGLGICASLLFKITGTLYASILFHMSCALGGVLLETIYPRLITVLGFLWQ